MIKISLCRSRAENDIDSQILLQTIFKNSPETKGLKPNIETQKSHGQGREIVALVCFRQTHKGLQRSCYFKYQTKKK